MTGKTSIPELISLIAYARFVVSNDTSVVHISAACDVKCFYICSGVHYGRFTGYPKEDRKYRANLPTCITDEKRKCFGCQLYKEKFEKINIRCRNAIKYNTPLPCINNISTDKAYNIIYNELIVGDRQ